ncbi:hypothetical protein [Alienimonas chondri]|uniref:Uncharacterized protein n=1 Tax=Alienimonas chondri TaxID=2681879 RepID=A0ABX1VDX1_9PLAN|nr:hypothetical protein [Alienimonas chondri]NNJ26290.1 hypothetical protein [Alienimonas chondri]
MPPQNARRTSRSASSSRDNKRTGPPRVLCVADLLLGAIPANLPALSSEAAAIAAEASLTTWESLVDAAIKEADALILTGRVFDPAADLRAERALRSGLERLAAADVSVFAVSDEPLPDDLSLTQLADDEASETELPRDGKAIAAVRVLAGQATFPVPDGLPVLGVTADPDADADGCDALFSASGAAPGTLLTLPETTGAGGVRSKPRGERPVRFFAPVLELSEEPDDLSVTLREAAPARETGERLRIVNWTLLVGPWGDSLLSNGADDLASSLSRSDAMHSIAVLPHPDRFADRDEETSEAAAFAEALSHFDPLGDGDAIPALAGVAPDADRVRSLATRFAAPLLSAG